MRRDNPWVELYERPVPLPGIPAIGQQVMSLERLSRLDAQRLEIQIDPARVRV